MSHTSSISRSRVITDAGLAQKQLQQVELPAREVQLGAGQHHAAAVGIEPQVAHLERLRRRLFAPGAAAELRRRTALMRATTSRALKGFTT